MWVVFGWLIDVFSRLVIIVYYILVGLDLKK